MYHLLQTALVSMCGGKSTRCLLKYRKCHRPNLQVLHITFINFSNSAMSGASEYMCVLHRATDQIPPKSSQCTPAAPAAVMSLDPTGSPKEQSKGLRLLRKAALVSGQILSFSDIADFYSDCVPIGTRVYGGGFYGVGGELTIGENETLYIHTVRKNVMAKAEISHNRKYHIPLDFTVPFGILYNPSGNIADARQGFTFESVESILNGKELPKVVRMECNVIDTAGGVVNFGEILIVKGTPAPKQLSVFSISTGNSSTLSKGVFSTDPSLIKMSLQQLHQFAHELLPCQAVLCCEEYPCVPAHLVSSVFTIKEFKSCTTLLVTSQLNTDISMMKVMELPDDLQFQIQITGTDTWPALAKTAKAISDAYPHLTSLYRYLGMPNEKMRQGQLFFYEANVRPATLENEYEVNTSTSMPVDNDYVEVSRPPTAGPLSPVYNVLSHANTNIRGNECQTKQQGNESLAPGSNEYITLFPAAPVYQAVEPLPPQNSNSARQAPQPKKRSQVTGSAVVPVASPQNTVGSPSLTGPPSQQASPSIPKVVPRPRPQSRLKPDMKNSAPEVRCRAMM